MTKWQTSTPCDLICRLRNSSLFLLGSEVSEILDKKQQIIVIDLDGGISKLFYSKKLKKWSLARNVVNKKRAALSPSSVN
jgi:hypothetical protein